jgi:hypothetical protein
MGIVGAVAIGLVGCGLFHHRHGGSHLIEPDDTEPFSCQGQAVAERPQGWVARMERLRRLGMEAHRSEGRLVVERVGDPPPEMADSPDTALGAVRVRVMADSVSLGSLATALGEAITAGVIVDPRLATLPVTLFLPDVEVRELAARLEGMYALRFEVAEGVLSLRWPPQPDDEVPPLIIEAIRLRGVVPAEQLASAFCHQIASARGSATVVGGGLVLRDTQARLDVGRNMIDEVEEQASQPQDLPVEELAPLEPEPTVERDGDRTVPSVGQ